jgi:hypothetical protein
MFLRSLLRYIIFFKRKKIRKRETFEASCCFIEAAKRLLQGRKCTILKNNLSHGDDISLSLWAINFALSSTLCFMLGRL